MINEMNVLLFQQPIGLPSVSETETNIARQDNNYYEYCEHEFTFDSVLRA